MSGGSRGGNLVPWPDSSSNTATSRASAVSCSPRSAGRTRRCAAARARLVQLRRPCDLVGRRRSRRAGGARPPAVLRRAASHRHQSRRGPDPVRRNAIHRVARGGTLVLGGGFAGGYVARRLGRAGATIVNPTNFMLYTPLLPEAAGGSIEPRHVVVPLRTMCPHADLLLGSVTRPRPRAPRSSRSSPTPDGSPSPTATSSSRSAPSPACRPSPGLAEHALRAQGPARRDPAAQPRPAPDRARRRGARARPTSRLTFVFAGAGFAGVEALAELQELVAGALRRHRRLRDVEAALVLVDPAPRILGADARAPRPLGGADARRPRHRDRHRRRAGLRRRDGRRAVRRPPDRRPGRVVWTAGVAANPLVAGSGCRSTSAGACGSTRRSRCAGHARACWALGDCAAVPTRRRPASSTRRPASTRCARRAGSRRTSPASRSPYRLPHARPDGDARAPPRHRRHRPAAGPRPRRLARRARLPPAAAAVRLPPAARARRLDGRRRCSAATSPS